MVQDIDIWATKIYLVRPAICAEEANIARYRRWTRQFYSAAELVRAGLHSGATAAEDHAQ